MIAAYVGKLLAVPDEDIIEALETVKLTRHRTEWVKAANGADLLADVYNANPTAMRLILETFAAIPANPNGKKIAVLADMKELGADSVALHSQLITSLDPKRIDQLVFYGDDIQALAKLASQDYPSGRVSFFKKNNREDQYEDMCQYLLTILEPNDQMLLKGSHSMLLANVVDRLTAPHAGKSS